MWEGYTGLDAQGHMGVASSIEVSFVEHGAYDPSTSKTLCGIWPPTLSTLCSPHLTYLGVGLEVLCTQGGTSRQRRSFSPAPHAPACEPCSFVSSISRNGLRPPACPHGHHSTLWCLRGVGVGAAACLPRGHGSAGRSGGDGIGAPIAHCILTLYSSHVLSHKRTVLPRQLRQRGGRGAWVLHRAAWGQRL